MIELELPYPPSANRYWRKFNNRMVISKHGKEFQFEVCRIVKDSGIEPIRGAIAIKILIYTPDWRRRDEDNLNKALLDAVSKSGIWDDDSFICYHVNEKRKDADGIGRIVLQVKPVDFAIVKKSGAWLK